MIHTMKTKFASRLSACLLAVAIVSAFTGCSATRPIDDAALGAGGAYLGNELSHGNPAATVAGAAGGVLLSEGLHYAAKTQVEKAYTNGYDKGKSDAVKQQYWLYVFLQQQQRNGAGAVRLYPVQLPEQRIDGVTFQPSTKYLRIEE
jgi:hypothetical protein